MLKGLVLVAVLAFILGLDLAPVVCLQLLILPSFLAVPGALFLFPSMFKSIQIEICMPLKNARFQVCSGTHENRKNNLILIMAAVKQDKTLELSKHWSADSTPGRNEVIMKTTYPVKSVKCDKIKLGCTNLQ